VILVDCDEYFTIDDKKIEEKITKKTKAIIPVHLYGQMANIININRICDKFGLNLIEDCAQSHFSELNSIKAGHTGIASTFSFFTGKNLGAYGDAGAILTNDKSLADNCTAFANHGPWLSIYITLKG
jgi:dTDP-4-amino-4,6-dideoxygalactose transaminase